MRTIALSLCLAFALALPAGSTAQTAQTAPARHDDLSRVPQVVLDGLEALRRGLLDEAEKAWSKDSAFLNPGRASGALTLYKQTDGDYQGFELISVQDVTQRTRVVYVSLDYERQPHFAKFVAYRTAREWVLLQLDLNVDMGTMQTELAIKAGNRD